MWNTITVQCCWLIPLAVQSMVWVFVRPFAGTVGSIAAGGMDVCL